MNLPSLLAPFSHFWLVEWRDNQALMQFDPDTGNEILFSEVIKRNKPIKRAAWLPFPEQLARRVAASGKSVKRLPIEALISTELPEGAELLLRKRVAMPLGANGNPGQASAIHVIGWRLGDTVQASAIDSDGGAILPIDVVDMARDIQPLSGRGKLTSWGWEGK